MRRFVSLAVLLFFTIPFGMSVTGCGHHSAPVVYCNGADSGPQVGQLYALTLSPTLALTGESVNYGQIGSFLSASGQDCKGGSVNPAHIVYATTDMSFADINPSTGQVCGGTWNRNTGGGIADYSICTPPTLAAQSKYLAYVTATADGITSNSIPVYVHPTATSIVFGKSASACSKDGSGNFIDPDNTCCPADPTTVITGVGTYDGVSCLSQNDRRQVAVRIYANGGGAPTDNITCRAGHLTFGTQGTSDVVTLDQNGVATAGQPGSVILTGNLSNSTNASSIGFFSTCPPVSIKLGAVGQSSDSFNVSLNNPQVFTTTATDKNGVTLTGLSLTYQSSQPQTLPASSGSATPILPGAATVTAQCLPPSCNSAPSSQIGYLGNGKPVTSNGITISTAGSSSTALVIGSTQSRNLYVVDFSVGTGGSLVLLPYAPNSMVITQDGSTVYLGSPQGLMVLSTASNAVSGPNVNVQGTVLSVSPDGTSVVVADPTRGLTSLVSNGSVTTSYGAVGTQARWTPDSSTVYITTTNGTVLAHSNFTNWTSSAIQQPSPTPSTDTNYTDVAVMVPAIGAYFAGSPATDGRSYCALTTQPSFTTPPPTESNFFNPLADSEPVPSDRITATSDGKHILGASATAGVSDLFLNNTTQGTGPSVCTNTGSGSPPSPPPNVAFSSTPHVAPFAGITVSSITGIASNARSSLAFVTLNGATTGKIPYYLVNNTTPNGSVNYFSFTDGAAALAPIAGVWATDDRTFYAGTSGDNLVHQIGVTYSAAGVPTLSETGQITPALPALTGTGTVPPNLIVQRPRKVTSGT